MESALFNHIRLWTFFLLSFASCPWTRAANILVIPTPHGSHISPFLTVTNLLRQKYNHESTFVLPPYMLHDPLLEGMPDKIIIAEKMDTFNFQQFGKRIMATSMKGITPVNDILQAFTSFCDLVLSDVKLIDELRKGNFNIVILDNFLYADCMNLIAYKLSIPYMVYGNFYEPINNGIPENPATVPDFPFTDYSSDMTFLQRVQNVIMFYAKALLFGHLYDSDVSNKYVPEKPYISIPELRSQVQLNLLDFDVLLDYPRATLPHIKYVGGLNTGPAKPLKPRLKSYMDSAIHGVVVVSFGTLVTEMPEALSSVLFSAMKKLPELKFIIRYGDKETEDENILKLSWIPQNDLLGHENTKVFITHCGNSGQFEALYHGVPMVGLPVGGDQIYNMRRMVALGYGLGKHISKAEETTLYDMIKEVVYNRTYKTKISKASEIFKSRPQSPSQRGAFWVDHVIKYGGDYMKSKGRSLPGYAYFSLDVYTFLIICLFFTLLCLQRVCSCVCTRIFKKKKKQKVH